MSRMIIIHLCIDLFIFLDMHKNLPNSHLTTSLLKELDKTLIHALYVVAVVVNLVYISISL
ncbi:unnamed protein product [Schistosoma haematobium]|nr:unnamed protein product [Schistosoma haematobium]